MPDDLHRRVKAKAALLGRPVREVTIDLYRAWLEEESETLGDPEQWLSDWIRLGREGLQGRSVDGPIVREVLEADRCRLDRP
jgi:hypothetical protein